MKRAGIFIIIIGIALTIFTAITFFTREKVADIGTVKITINKPHRLSWSPLIGIAVIAIGGGVLLLSRKKS
jgi:LPXTG-motif cell wall-anchored protein